MHRQTTVRLGMLITAALAWPGVAGAQSWLTVQRLPRADFRAGNALQLTDGTIMVQEYGTSNWWKLSPDENANYSTGTWSQLASATTPALPMDYAPFQFAAAVLPDGRVIVEGGEYTFSGGKRSKTNTNQGAIYDPVLNTWTPVPAPCPLGSNPVLSKVCVTPPWPNIGDAPSVVLADGTFMLGNIYDTAGPLSGPYELALLDPSTLTWTIVVPKGKFDRYWEEGWTLLPSPAQNPRDGNVLTVDTYLGAPAPGTSGYKLNNSELYDPATQTWTSAGNTVVPLTNTLLICNGSPGGHEVGPAVLRPDGTVFATGAATCGSGNTAIYDPVARRWTVSQPIPYPNYMADAPAAVLPDGNVLVLVSQGKHPPASFYEFGLKSNSFTPTPIPGPSGFSQDFASEDGRMLVVASGHVLFIHVNSPEMAFYVPKGTYNPLWAPVVEAVRGDLGLPRVHQGGTYTVSGTQLNGLSQGAYFGDENQAATNFPLVLIENCQTGHKTFARTRNFSTMGVATGLFTPVTAEFTVSPGTETGASSLIVIANGIPSQPAGGSCGLTVLSSSGN
jgi:hypothetical protein